MAKDKYTTGSDIASTCMKCTKCVAHTVVAISGSRITKVRCNTCGNVGPYFKPDSPFKLPRKSSSAVSAAEEWEKAVGNAASKKKIPYTTSGKFEEKDLIDHPTFGLGIVTVLLPGDKIQVIFKEEKKVLVTGR